MKIGLITYHAAYNYGSLLQAFALKKALENLGYQCEIINYRFKGQKDFYKLIRTKYGLKIMFLDILQFPAFIGKIKRNKKMELFIKNRLEVGDEFTQPYELENIRNLYDVYISGSDQIWSKYSSELYFEDWSFMYPYLLSFTDKKKVSYASSIGSMQESDLDHIKKYLLKFSNIAMRESSASIKLSNYLNRDIYTVLDPTLLLNKEEYIRELNLKKEKGNYILFYTLRGIKETFKQYKKLYNLSRYYGINIYSITPFCYLGNNKHYINKIDSGVEDFLNLIYGADLIITDSFHGMTLSLVFKKNFYSLCKGWDTDYRKIDLLENLGLSDRIISDINECDLYNIINYNSVDEKVNKLRRYSYEYLKESIG